MKRTISNSYAEENDGDGKLTLEPVEEREEGGVLVCVLLSAPALGQGW